MTWEISMVAEGWDDIRTELWTNWDAKRMGKAIGDYNFEKFHNGNPHHKGAWSWKKFANLPINTLVDKIIECIQDTNTTDNGGNGFWIDPDGFHKVYI
jgi:hypothetical protein